ncbi:MAG: pilus assembly protein [Alphaproteobacteria bacterium]|nr:pilus assembly protein [Alphaproteobacteria bacterium]
MALNALKYWWNDDRAVIALEVGILMPVLLTLLLGAVDIGSYIYTDQKLLDADQMIADLLTRNPTIATSDLQDAVTAGQLTLEPNNTATFGVDIAGIQFQGGPTQPVVAWRYDTANATQNGDVPADADNLGNDQDGVIVVTTTYTFVPPLLGGLADVSYSLKEVAIARGRNGLYIPWNQ